MTEIRAFTRILIWLSLAALLSSCGDKGGKTQTSESRFTAVATTGMIADALRHLLPDSVEVVALMGAGVDPHLYKATQGDLQRLLKADLVVYNGLHLEGRMGDALKAAARQRHVVAIGDLLEPQQLLRADENAPDPHIWHDAGLWREAVGELADTLARIFPAQAEDLRRRADQYVDSLGALDRWVRAEIGRLPAERRVLVTAHDAFGYFGRAYGLQVRGVQGMSTAAEPGLHDVQALVDFMSEKKIPALFVESSVPKRTVEAVLEGCRKRGHAAKLGGELHSDALGPKPADTYSGMIRHNVMTLTEALR